MSGRDLELALQNLERQPEAKQADPGAARPAHAIRTRVVYAALVLLLVAGVAVLVAVAALIAMVLFASDRMREPIANRISERIARPVAIRGHLKVALSFPIAIEAEDVVVGSGREGAPELLHIPRLGLRVELLPLLHKQIVIPEAHAYQPTITLEKDSEGRVNWLRAWPTTRPPHPPQVGSLRITGGKIIYRDAVLAIKLDLVVESDTEPQTASQSPLKFGGHGTVAKLAFRVDGRAANPRALVQPGTPYAVEIKADAKGATGTLSGTFILLDWNAVDGRFTLKGNDLSKLLNIASMHSTPRYQWTGQVTHKDSTWFVDGMELKVGRSDLSGKLSVTRNGGRPAISADIRSKQLDLSDIGVITERPSRSSTETADARVLPTKAIDPQRFRRTDVDLRFRGERVWLRKLALNRLEAHVALKQGELHANRLDFDLAQGRLHTRLSLDARGPKIKADIDTSLRDVQVMALLPALTAAHGSEGRMSGRAIVHGTGNSMTQLLGNAEGTVDLHVADGRVDALALVLTSLDMGKAIKLVLFGNHQAQVSCIVAGGTLKDGVLVVDHLAMESSEANIVGSGQVDFRDERYQLRIAADPKHASFAKLHGPVIIEGTFEHPDVHPEERSIAAKALAVIAAPFAALLPPITGAHAKDTGCSAYAAAMGKRDGNSEFKR